jgi:hypothetical protein
VPDGASKANPQRVLRVSIARRVLPTPGPPPSMTSDPRPVSARSMTSRIAKRSVSRPTKAVRSASESGDTSSAASGACGWSTRAGARSPLEVGWSAGSITVAANSHAIGKSGSGW